MLRVVELAAAFSLFENLAKLEAALVIRSRIYCLATCRGFRRKFSRLFSFESLNLPLYSALRSIPEISSLATPLPPVPGNKVVDMHLGLGLDHIQV